MARMVRQAPVPPEYEGGIGQEGVDALKAFVEKGGRLVALNGACEFAITEFGAPARNILSGVDRAKFFCPTSILRILVDNETPIGYGMPKEAAAMFVNSLAFDTFSPSYDWDRKVVAAYPEDEILIERLAPGRGVPGPQGRRRRHQVQGRPDHPHRHPLPEPGPVPRDLQVPAERPALSQG
ncbi:MAG: hypothetical protein M0C28_38305 [Candidatus Moduliflexus flocculans]|nr:hypothetical protein [Candidatus Moduliflexus flocculans]